ncbi:DUF4262 domain-containing protein [Conexibacter sp. SYSU D00693]|uniref:DUF4262 domain-containing protein n=1 Tax=Conexibacter sp. SYSU D00693 TaxID=2812560 RepID=UPI00196B80F5|nr:DUF4262 domain-containing protein [Conexibacter sp. SYSU D00693]
MPQPRNPAEEKAAADIAAYGWHCVFVGSPPDQPPSHPVFDASFGATVGLPQTYGHAELVLVGRFEHAHRTLAGLVERIAGGETLSAGREVDGVRLGAVSAMRRHELLQLSAWAAEGEPFDALQVLVPDEAGRFPDQDGYAGPPQPLLSTVGR